ncbi:hypothetical protein C7974DRAFT_195567 [Boeremia exigua]|uniref:uncharacterized protein n=1 Tax=Boeremia exigua TaxID=749465 RepID=UPI001E8CDD6E|nr:uncharacterized protein C7974DRAFT_195567 [Boeremia exigua]KAH6625150.1 hypothetical protein C7974DRAFT_195567 [Boeremia exigua]
MSTAIALQSIDAKETATLRQRRADSSQDNAWISSPHDVSSSALPLDSSSLSPTSIYWITPHGILTKAITILDLTHDMPLPSTGLTDTYKAAIKTTLKDHSFTPIITCHRQSWIGLKYTIQDDQHNPIAQWSQSWFSAGEAVLTFPADSPHSSHPISLKNKRWGLRTESFTVNSQLFSWQMDSAWHSYNMTLYKVLGSGEHQKKIEVGKYSQKWWGSCATGGAFVFDEGIIDGVVAALTLVVVLKKKRQRAAERYGNGAH